MAKEKADYVSKCCKAEVKSEGIPDFIGSDEVVTVHYVCKKCGEPCDVVNKEGLENKFE